MSINDSAAFFSSGGAKYFPFATIGTRITGTIAEEPIQRQQTDPASGALLSWPDGNPKQVLVVTLQTDLRSDDPNDGGRRSVWAPNPGGIRNALIRATKAAGVEQFDVGGKLTVEYVANGEKRNVAHNAPKLYEATYVPPVGDSAAFLAEEDPAPTGVDPAVWATLPPEARAAMASLAAK